MLDSVLAWAGVVDELDFAKRLKDWCQRGYPELGDSEGIILSPTIKKVSTGAQESPPPKRSVDSIPSPTSRKLGHSGSNLSPTIKSVLLTDRGILHLTVTVTIKYISQEA